MTLLATVLAISVLITNTRGFAVGESTIAKSAGPLSPYPRVSCDIEAHCRYREEPHEINVESSYSFWNEYLKPPTDTKVPLPSTGSPGSSPETTRAPSEAPSQDGSPSSCVTNVNGLFGSSSTMKILLDYFFEVEYDQQELFNIVPDALLQIERATSNVLLPVFFKERCSDQSQELHESDENTSAIVGVSTLPNDVVLPGVDCQDEYLSVLNSCVLVHGKATLFIADGQDAEAAGVKALQALKANMDSGALLDSVHKGIARMSFVNGTFNIFESSDEDFDQPKKDDGDNGGLPVVAYVMIGLAPIIVVAVILAVRMGKNQDGTPTQDEARMWLIPLDSLSSDTSLD